MQIKVQFGDRDHTCLALQRVAPKILDTIDTQVTPASYFTVRASRFCFRGSVSAGIAFRKH
jgi:hypothetical protein